MGPGLGRNTLHFQELTRTVIRAVLASAVLAGGPAMASATQFTIDLRGSAFAPDTLTDTWTANAGIPGDDLSLTVRSNIGHLTHDPALGFGVNSTAGYDFDEVEGDERITFEFSRPVFLVAFGITHFFRESVESGTPVACTASPSCYREEGYMMVNDSGSWTQLLTNFLDDPSAHGAGYNQFLSLQKAVTRVEFRFPGLIYPPGFFGYPQTHEAAIRNFLIDIPDPPQPVPEPTTVVLMATGLVGLAMRRSRKDSSQQ
jgi:hypothetical protein